jgi:hypothetical protein
MIRHCAPLVACLSLFASLLLVAGCGSAGSGRAEVSGAVQFDGKPVTAGGIRFIAQDKDGVNTPGLILDGKYEMKDGAGPVPGKYKVQISWLKKTGRTINTSENNDPEYARDETIEQIPAKYNANTTLEVDIKPGTNTHDFDLKR